MDHFGGSAQSASSKAHNGMEEVTRVAGDVADHAMEMGSDALDKVDEYLKPVGLSLKHNPIPTLAILGGLALTIGALWMSRRQQPHNLSAMMNQIGDYARKTRWS